MAEHEPHIVDHDSKHRRISDVEYVQLVNARDGIEHAHHRLDMLMVPREEPVGQVLTVAGRLQVLEDSMGVDIKDHFDGLRG